jgi:hypothetical protein
MRNRISSFIVVAVTLLVLVGCGDQAVVFVSFNGGAQQGNDTGPGGTSEGGSGLLVAVITDAKPLIPSGTEEVWITVKGVLVHREEGNWISLPLVQTPYTVDLLRFQSGNSTDLIRPVRLESGTYDRIRFLLENAYVVRDGNNYPALIPPGRSTVEKDFFFDLEEDGFVDLTVDFDLSLSLKVTESPPAPSYELTPFLRINHTEEAALIQGKIAATTFDTHGSGAAVVAVFMDSDSSGDLTADDAEYTRIKVDRDSPGFTIFWLIPEEGYTVALEMGGAQPTKYEQYIYPADLQKGGVFQLNQGNPI